MDRKEKLKYLAKLESYNDQLLTEKQQVHSMLHALGFDKGFETLLWAAEDLVHLKSKWDEDQEDAP